MPVLTYYNLYFRKKQKWCGNFRFVVKYLTLHSIKLKNKIKKDEENYISNYVSCCYGK